MGRSGVTFGLNPILPLLPLPLSPSRVFARSHLGAECPGSCTDKGVGWRVQPR